jgi:hypothetical protein
MDLQKKERARWLLQHKVRRNTWQIIENKNPY